MSLIDKIRKRLLDTQSQLIWIPTMKKEIFDLRRTDFLDLPSFLLLSDNMNNFEINLILKRYFDFFVSLMCILIFLPLMVVISLLIKFESRGPVFYTQNRSGLNGKNFKMIKFRSMKLHDESEYKQTTKHDDRITSIGKFIRKYSIDELPQLINVLKGDMSLVGPRPHAVEINQKYQDKIDKYMARHKVKPGMTGLAQIKGYRGGDDLDSMKKRTFYDLEYINKWSLFFDIKILAKTPFALFNDDIF